MGPLMYNINNLPLWATLWSALKAIPISASYLYVLLRYTILCMSYDSGKTPYVSLKYKKGPLCSTKNQSWY